MLFNYGFFPSMYISWQSHIPTTKKEQGGKQTSNYDAMSPQSIFCLTLLYSFYFKYCLLTLYLSHHFNTALFPFCAFKIPTKCDSAVFLCDQDLPVLHIRAGLGCFLTLVSNYFPNCPAQTKTLYAAPPCQLYSHATFLSARFALRTAQPRQKTITNCG
jgi:hypothetical protein